MFDCSFKKRRPKQMTKRFQQAPFVEGGDPPDSYWEGRRMWSYHFARTGLFTCIMASAAAGQVSFHFGLEARVPLTDTLVSSSESSTSQFPAYSLLSRFSSKTKRLLIGTKL